MNDLGNVKAIAFDFGGTLDIPGVHWFDYFWHLFKGNLFCDLSPVTKEQYWNAYVYGEQQMEKNLVPRELNLYETIIRKVKHQLTFIAEHDYTTGLNQHRIEGLAGIWAMLAATYVEENLRKVLETLRRLKQSYDLSVVSNYYGNLEFILKDYRILDNFHRVLDSTVVGIRKPDPAIWKMAIDLSGHSPEEFLVIGDSMKNDILPAQSLGCPTILVTNESPPEGYKGISIESVGQLTMDNGQLTINETVSC